MGALEAIHYVKEGTAYLTALIATIHYRKRENLKGTVYI